MELKTKYNVGQRVKIEAEYMYDKECPFCNGQGYLMINENKIRCKTCDSTGKLFFYSNEKNYVEGIIKRIEYSVDCKPVDEYDHDKKHKKTIGNCAHVIKYYIKAASVNLKCKDFYYEDEIRKIK